MPTVKEALQLLQEEAALNERVAGPVYLVVKLTSEKPLGEQASDVARPSPQLIPLPHRFVRRSNVHTCLIVKDPVQLYRSLLEKSETTQSLFDDIVSLRALNVKLHGSDKAAQLFMKTYSAVFVQDSALVPAVRAFTHEFLRQSPKLLIPVKLGRRENILLPKHVKAQVQAALRSAQVIERELRIRDVQVAHTAMDLSKAEQNVLVLMKSLRQKHGPARFTLRTARSVQIPVSLEDAGPSGAGKDENI